jgi:hypothetical protein
MEEKAEEGIHCKSNHQRQKVIQRHIFKQKAIRRCDKAHVVRNKGYGVYRNYLSKSAQKMHQRHFLALYGEKEQGVKIAPVFELGKLKNGDHRAKYTQNRCKKGDISTFPLISLYPEAIGDGYQAHKHGYGHENNGTPNVFL